MKPVCVPCQRFFRIKKIGVCFVEAMPAPGTRHPLPGTAEPDKWVPYKLWSGDRWECDGCGATIISGVGRGPLAEHYEPHFDGWVKEFNAELQVNDC